MIRAICRIQPQLVVFSESCGVSTHIYSPLRFSHTIDTSDGSGGSLEKWKHVLVYRTLLYWDDFNASGFLYPERSVGACYMAPLWLRYERRKRQSRVRTIYFTPPGVWTSQVMYSLLPDIIQGTKEGLEMVVGKGRPVQRGFDVCEFLGSSPALS